MKIWEDKKTNKHISKESKQGLDLGNELVKR